MAIVEDVPEPVPGSNAYSTATDIPLRHPSELHSRHAAEPLIDPSSLPSSSTKGTGIKVSEVAVGATPLEEKDEDGDFQEEVFDTIMLTVPFSFLFILLHILVHLQYSHRPSWDGVLNSLITAIPTLGITLFYSTRYASSSLTRGAMMTASLLSGARLIWLVNKSSWVVVTAQAPAMGTIWILTIVQLPLSRGLLCLLGVGGWVWWTGLSVYP